MCIVLDHLLDNNLQTYMVQVTLWNLSSAIVLSVFSQKGNISSSGVVWWVFIRLSEGYYHSESFQAAFTNS